jgi:hypothetical protein
MTLHIDDVYRRYLLVKRADMAYIKFIFEAYEGIATLSTLNGRTGSMQVTFFSHFAEDVDGLLNALKFEAVMSEITSPDDGFVTNHQAGEPNHA